MSTESIPPASDALATGKLRFRDNTPTSNTFGPPLLHALYALARQRQPTPPGNSQDETIWIQSAESGPETSILHIHYSFDHDYASQYDKTEAEHWEVQLTPDPLSLTLLTHSAD